MTAKPLLQLRQQRKATELLLSLLFEMALTSAELIRSFHMFTSINFKRLGAAIEKPLCYPQGAAVQGRLRMQQLRRLCGPMDCRVKPGNDEIAVRPRGA